MNYPLKFLKEQATAKNLSKGQREVFLLKFGEEEMDNKKIAEQLGISESAVKDRMTGVYKNFEIYSKGPTKEIELTKFLDQEYQKWLEQKPREKPVKISRFKLEREYFQKTRETSSLTIHNALQNSPFLAVHGIAGVGKTELVLQYAYEYKDKDDYSGGLLWLDVRGKELFQEIKEFAAQKLSLELLETSDEEERKNEVEKCWSIWSQHFSGNKLLIIDDVTQNEWEEVQSYLPLGRQDFKVILTTRLDLDVRWLAKINPKPFETKDAKSLLAKLIDRERIKNEDNEAKKLCDFVGNLPLGITLLSKYLNVHKTDSLEETLNSLNEKGLDRDSGFLDVQKQDEMLNFEVGGRNIYEGVYEVFNLSWDFIDYNGKQLGSILSLFDIPPSVWSQVEKTAGKINQGSIRGKATYNLNSINIIHDRYNNPLHPLVQEFFMVKLKKDPDFFNIDEDLFGYLLFQQYIYDAGYLVNNLKRLEVFRQGVAVQDNNKIKGRILLNKMLGHAYYKKDRNKEENLYPALNNLLRAYNISCQDGQSIDSQDLLRWYQIFLVDHSQHLIVTGNANQDFVSDDSKIWQSSDLKKIIENQLLPDDLQQVETVPRTTSLMYILRAAHYWGHQGNQVVHQLEEKINDLLGNKDETIEEICRNGIEYYRRAAIFRLMNIYLSFSQKYDENLRRLISNDSNTPKWLNEWKPSLPRDSIIEQFTSISQAIGDTAHQYRGINNIQLWNYAYQISIGEPVDAIKIEQINHTFEITTKLWDLAENLLDKGTNETLIIYFMWIVPLKIMKKLVNQHFYKEQTMLLESIKIQVESEINRLKKEHNIIYDFAEKSINTRLEWFHRKLFKHP